MYLRLKHLVKKFCTVVSSGNDAPDTVSPREILANTMLLNTSSKKHLCFHKGKRFSTNDLLKDWGLKSFLTNYSQSDECTMRLSGIILKLFFDPQLK